VKQKVKVTLEVEFDDGITQADVDEALEGAVASLRRSLAFVPSLKGKSARGRVVAFKVRVVALLR